MELIRLDDIRKTYHLGEVDVPVLNGISFSIKRGETMVLGTSTSDQQARVVLVTALP